MTTAPPRISLGPALKDWQGNALEYLRYEYPLTFDDLVIDLGAYRGEFATQLYNQYRCSIICVEPSEYIKSMPTHEGKISIINKAAGTHNGVMDFGGGAYYTSVFEEHSHKYECFDIADLIEQCGGIALLKLNVEGCEYSLLDHIIGRGLHKKIKNIQVQFHMIDGAPFEKWYKEINQLLKETHHISWKYDYVWENWVLNER